ncbi:MAG: GNAT family N-acetyltransferase [Pseudohongiellaceae bacterium]|nr:GNAT family N-acetyltransferase [Pseudohongiellaceae bacterium]
MTHKRINHALWELNQKAGGEALDKSESEFGLLVHLADFSIIRKDIDEIQGFMLGMASGRDIEHFSYQWFMARYDNFLYIDRVVVDESARGNALASSMYEEARFWARQNGIDKIVCQLYDRPPMPEAHTQLKELGFEALESVMLPSREIVTMYQRSTAIATP